MYHTEVHQSGRIPGKASSSTKSERRAGWDESLRKAPQFAGDVDDKRGTVANSRRIPATRHTMHKRIAIAGTQHAQVVEQRALCQRIEAGYFFAPDILG